MPPRKRPKKGLRRIDAAIDAMLPLGFTAKQVRKCVKQLLKEYGGDEQWPFIEDASYSELIAALLRDVDGDNQEEATQDGNPSMQDQNPLQDKSNGEEEPSTSRYSASENLQDERSPGNTVAIAEPVLDGKGWEDVISDQTFVPQRTENCPTKLVSPRIETALPCYGWIEDEEEEDEFNLLRPKCNHEEDKELKDKCNGKEKPSMTHNGASDTLQDEKSPANMVVVAEPVLDQTYVVPVKNEPPTKVGSQRIRNGRGLHCYGWVEDDEEEDANDFIILRSSSMVLGPPKSDA